MDFRPEETLVRNSVVVIMLVAGAVAAGCGSTARDASETSPQPSAAPAAGSFCADLKAKYGAGILRCVDFATENDAAINWVTDGRQVISKHLYDSKVSATDDSTGSLHWKVKSYRQVKSEEPTLPNGEAWHKAMHSGIGIWQRWIGEPYAPGKTYYVQFKYRFNNAFKTWWGGGGPKVFAMAAGCRQDPRDATGRTWIPPLCDATLNLPGQRTAPDRITDHGTADSTAFVMTTTNWWPSSAGRTADNRPYPVMYQGSANFFALTNGFTPIAYNPQFGTSQIEQPGPDANGRWDGTKLTNTCDALSRVNNPDFVSQGRCVTYGAPDVWHQVTMMLRPSGNYYNHNPKAPPNEKVFRHDTVLKVWYDGKLMINFDSEERPFRRGQPSATECAARQLLHPAYDDCRTGIDLFRDSDDLPVDCTTQQPSEKGRCGSSYPVYSAPWIAGDRGADPSRFDFAMFSYRRGYPTRAWCDSEIGAGRRFYNECLGFSSGPDEPGRFAAFLDHPEVHVYYDDWVVSTVPLHESRSQRNP